jgi:L-fuculose-phosphate aldolase
MVLIDLLKKELVAASRTIYLKNLVQRGEGNLSIRIPDTDEFLVTPTYNDYENMTTDDVVHMNFKEEQISGSRKASSEYRLHISIYQARPKVNAVIHTHSPYATMMAVARIDLPMLLEEMVVWAGGKVKCADFSKANSSDIGPAAVKALTNNNAILIANHGVLVCGRDMDAAIKIAELVEKMALIHKGAHDYGKVHEISNDSYEYFRKKFDEYYSTSL